MSFSRSFTVFYVSIAVIVQRTVGRLISKGVKKDNIKAKLLPNYFAKKYLSCIDSPTLKQITVKTPETIWQFWDNPAGQRTPEIVKSSLESVEKFKGNFDRKTLNKSTIENYADLPDYVFDKLKKGQMCYAHFSDLLRLNLLKNHGGIWMDATCYMTDFIPDYIVNQDFFVFLTGKQTSFPYSFMQNCFIRAKMGSYICDIWYLMCCEYWKTENRRIDYFQHQLMFKSLILNDSTAKKIFAEMPHVSEDGTHQLVGNNLLKEFNPVEWERIKNASFFQKTRYKIKKAQASVSSKTYFSMLSKGEL